MRDKTPDKTLLRRVRAKFIENGTSLHKWCRQSGVDWSYACKSLTGEADFPAACELRMRIIRESGLWR